MRTLALIAALCAPAVALADAPALDFPRNAVSVRPFALTSHGFNAEYERYFPWHALSVAAGPDLRFGAGGDFQSLTLGAGAEARLWLRGSVLRHHAPLPMEGPYASARGELAFTSLRDRVDGRGLGAMATTIFSVGLGWRFALGPVQLSPSIALGLDSELGGGLAGSTRGTAILGFTAGWMF